MPIQFCRISAAMPGRGTNLEYVNLNFILQILWIVENFCYYVTEGDLHCRVQCSKKRKV